MIPVAVLTNRYVLGAAGILVGLAALWGFGQYKYHVGYTEAERARSMADLVAFVEESHRLAILSDQLEQRIAELREVQPKIIERYNSVVVEKPLPADCRIDAGRLQQLSSAIKAANSGQPGEPVPKN